MYINSKFLEREKEGKREREMGVRWERDEKNGKCIRIRTALYSTYCFVNP